MENNIELKELLKNEKYNECAKLIENKIINYIINLIKAKGIELEDTGLFDLIEASNKFLDGDEKFIAEKIKFFSIDEEPIEKLERLLEICKVYNIK